jgi:hypothetical protein
VRAYPLRVPASELETLYRQAVNRGIPIAYLLEDRPANRFQGRSKARFPLGGYLLSLLVATALVWLCL